MSLYLTRRQKTKHNLSLGKGNCGGFSIFFYNIFSFIIRKKAKKKEKEKKENIYVQPYELRTLDHLLLYHKTYYLKA